jgi:hypothetical protein
MTYRTYIGGVPPEVAANTFICHSHRCNFLDTETAFEYKLQYLALLINLDGSP